MTTTAAHLTSVAVHWRDLQDALGAPADFDDWASHPRRLLEHAREVGMIRDPSFPPSLDDWCAYIVNGTKSRKLILADHTSERRVKNLLVKLQSLSKKEVEKLAKG